MKSLLWAFICLFFSSFTHSQLIYSYTNDLNGSYNSIASNATATGLIAGGGINIATGAAVCPDGYNIRGFGTSTTYNVNSIDYIEFGVTPSTNYKLVINSFSIDMRRSNSGPASIRFAYKIGSGSFTDNGSDSSPNNGSCGSTSTSSWSSLNIETTMTVIFRIYGYNASAGTGNLQLKNVTVSGNVALPVTITYFRAKQVPNKNALQWQTASEINNDHFEIEESPDGKIFKKIGEVKGQGTTNDVSNYEYALENTFLLPILYYRLKQVDFDGKYEYSPIISYIGKGKSFKLYSNIVQSDLRFDYENVESVLPYSIYNHLGMLILRGQAASHTPINISHLPTGFYFIKTHERVEKFYKQ